MIVQCKMCQKEVSKRPSELKNRKNIFCSQQCLNKWKSENKKGENNHNYSRISYPCDNCKKEFILRPYILKELQDGKRKNIFCSKVCHNQFRKEQKPQRNAPVSGKFKTECKCCGTSFLVNNYEKNRLFCSKECSDRSKLNKKTMTCDNCGDKYEVLPSMSDKRRFCSQKCTAEWQKEHNSTKLTKVCVTCGNEYKVSPCFFDSLTCSKRCAGLNNLKNRVSKDTKPERMVKDFLKLNDIEFNPQYLALNKYNVDFYLPKYDIIIEVQGNYWHGNPKMYGDGEECIRPLTEKQKDRIEKDKIRFTELSSQFKGVYFVWEQDIYDDIDTALYFIKSLNLN